MKYLAYFIFLSILIFGSCGQPPFSSANPEATEESLMKAINDFNLAFKEGNAETLGAMITQNYIHTNGSSKAIGRDTWLNYLSGRQKDIDSGKIMVESYEMEDVRIELHGHTAIVSAKISVNNRIEGELQERFYRVTNIWVMESGKWKRAGFHDGKIQ